MVQREQLLQELVHDTYKSKTKLPEPASCPDCGSVYRNGRWTWEAAAPGSERVVCPACQRIRDRLPAGFVSLRGAFLAAHHDEVVKAVRHCEVAEKREHPLQRIMAVEGDGSGLTVTTTDPHLARRIGEALHKAYKGKLEYHYNKAENLLRVSWER